MFNGGSTSNNPGNLGTANAAVNLVKKINKEKGIDKAMRACKALTLVEGWKKEGTSPVLKGTIAPKGMQEKYKAYAEPWLMQGHDPEEWDVLLHGLEGGKVFDEVYEGRARHIMNDINTMPAGFGYVVDLDAKKLLLLEAYRHVKNGESNARVDFLGKPCPSKIKGCLEKVGEIPFNKIDSMRWESFFDKRDIEELTPDEIASEKKANEAFNADQKKQWLKATTSGNKW